MQELLAARVAAVASLALVDSGTVTPHRRHIGETARTLGTLVRTLARMDGHVLLEVAELREPAPADVARERTHVVV